MTDYPDLCKSEYKGKTSLRLKRPTLLAFAFAAGKDPFALYGDPKAYSALMDNVGKTLAACKGNLKFFWDNKDQLLNGMLVGSDPPLTVMMYGRMREGASPVLNAVSLFLMVASALLALTMVRRSTDASRS